jgi:hypothetical protein
MECTHLRSAAKQRTGDSIQRVLVKFPLNLQESARLTQNAIQRPARRFAGK